MDYKTILSKIEQDLKIAPLQTGIHHGDEVYAAVMTDDFKKVCLALHKELKSPVMTLFARDEVKNNGRFLLY